MAARFINVDLDVESKQPLDYFCVQMANGTDIFILHSGDNGARGYMARLEYASGVEFCDPDSLINAFCEQLENLDSRAKLEWEKSYKKTFDLGFEFAGNNFNYGCNIREDTLKRLSGFGASVAISIYDMDAGEGVDKS